VQNAIRSAAGRVVRDGKCLIGVGGDHSITSALVQAVQSRYKALSVLQIDAHADLRNRYQGSPHSHACAMRRVTDLGVRVQPVGLRTCTLEEHRFMKKHRITPIWARQTLEDPDWIMRAIDGLSDEVYITLDIDAFDPAFAPGTGTPEPGGLDWYQVTDLLQAVAMQRTVVAADIVEVMPLVGTVQTEFLAARLIYKLIAHVEANR
jgi:agmatinase